MRASKIVHTLLESQHEKDWYANPKQRKPTNKADPVDVLLTKELNSVDYFIPIEYDKEFYIAQQEGKKYTPGERATVYYLDH